jgi:hypothetical protein
MKRNEDRVWERVRTKESIRIKSIRVKTKIWKRWNWEL